MHPVSLAVLLLAAPVPAVNPRVDAYGDPLPARAVARIGTVRALTGGHQPLLLPPTYTTVLHVERGRRPVVREVATGRVVRAFDAPPAGKWVQLSNVSADGRWVVGTMGDRLTVWDTGTGRHRDRVPPNPPYFTIPAALSADGRVLAYTGPPTAAGPVPVWVWDLDAGKELARVALVQTRRLAAVALSADGHTLATFANFFNSSFTDDPVQETTVQVWDVGTGKERFRVRAAGPRPPTHVAFSPDGKTLAASGYKAIERWDTATGKPLPALTPTLPGIGFHFAFSPDGQTVAAAGDHHAEWWSAADGKSVRAVRDIGPQHGRIAFPDDRTAIVYGVGDSHGYTRVRDTATGRPIAHEPALPHGVISFAFPPDRAEVLTAFSRESNGRIARWSLATGKPLGDLPPPKHPDPGFTVKTIATGALTPDGAWCVPSQFPPAVYDTTNGERKHGFPSRVPDGIARSATLSPCGHWVHTTPYHPGEFASVPCEVWERATGRLVGSIDVPAACVGPVAVSRDGTRVVTAANISRTEDRPIGAVRVAGWDVATGRKLAEVVVPDAHAAPAVAPDGRTVLLPGDDRPGLVAVDFVAGTVGRRLATEEAAGRPAFSPDGRLLAVGTGGWENDRGVVELFDWASGRRLAALDGHTASAGLVTFSPDGKLLASHSWDGTALIWDVGPYTGPGR